MLERLPCSCGRALEFDDKAHIPSARPRSIHAADRVAPPNRLIIRAIGKALFSTSPTNRTSPVRPPSAIATACFVLATSKATNTSLYSPMVRPPCMRLGSGPARATLVSLPHERAGHRPKAPRTCAHSEDRVEGVGEFLAYRGRQSSRAEFSARLFFECSRRAVRCMAEGRAGLRRNRVRQRSRQQRGFMRIELNWRFCGNSAQPRPRSRTGPRPIRRC